MFHTIDDLNTYFAMTQVMAKSVYFRPRDIGKLLDADDHPVVFHPDDGFGYRCSEPKRIKAAASGQAFVGRLSEQVQQISQEEPSNTLFDSLTGRILEGSRKWIGDLSTAVRNYSSRQKAAVLSRIVLGAELWWVVRDE